MNNKRNKRSKRSPERPKGVEGVKGSRLKDKRGRPGQVAIELTAAFMIVFMLLVATARIFVWFADNLAARHKHFEDTRAIVGSSSVSYKDVQNFNYQPSELRLVD